MSGPAGSSGSRHGRRTAIPATAPARRRAPSARVRGRLVGGAAGRASRLSAARGLRRRGGRPLAVAVRTYSTSPRHADDYLEVWLDLRDGRRLLPGYGWIFGMGDGTSNVGVGLLNTAAGRRNIDFRAPLRRWLPAAAARSPLPGEGPHPTGRRARPPPGVIP